MIAVTGEAEVGPVARCASAIVTAWARIATWTLRLRSPDVVAGVKLKSALRPVPRRARRAASRGSETAGVKAPIGRALNDIAVGRFALLLWVVAPRAGASSSAIAASDAPPAMPMARSPFKTLSPLQTGI